MQCRVGRVSLRVFIVLAILASSVHAQETPPPDSPGPSTDTMQPDGTVQPADIAVEPAENTPTPTPGDAAGQPREVTVQPADSSGQSAATCGAQQTQVATSASNGRPLRPIPKPGQDNTVVPLFCRPFSGEYSTVDFFDHDLPFVFNDHNGYQLTWWGVRVGLGLDGHNGYDWTMPEGTPIFAVAPGEIVFAGSTPPSACPIVGHETIGNVVTIGHQVNTPTETLRVRSGYYHLSRIDVQVGKMVNAGDQVGLSGNTGCSGGPHLHFQTDLFAKGRFINIDPYGWEAPGPDPWAEHPRGAPSLWLWQDGQAPAVAWRDREQAPNTGTAPVEITFVRWLAARDDLNPNNEFVELTLNPRNAPSGTYDLSGHTLRNNQGDTFTFPGGFRMQQGTTVRVYVGSGRDSPTELYWGRNSGVFDPMGDCIRLQGPTWRGPYRLGLGIACK
jgi:murein DD-endopeptidase MepM/ murein hydrolase activator NlpD